MVARRMATWSLLVASSLALGAGWPTYLQNAGRVGATTESPPANLKLAWVHSSPQPPRLAWEGPRSTPIEGKVMLHRVDFDKVFHVAADKGRVYFGSSVDHQLKCLESKTGTTLWTFTTGAAIRLAPSLWRDRVYFGSDDGHVYCLSASNGKLIWKHRVGPSSDRILGRGQMVSRWPVRTGVLIDRGQAFFGAGIFPHAKVFLCCADALTGKMIWKNDHISQVDAGRNPLSPQGYLLASEQYLFVPSGRSLPAAFNRRTGEPVHHRSYSWRTAAGGVVGGTKAILADGQIYTSGPHHFLALNQKDGSVGFAFITGRQLTLSQSFGFVADGKHVSGLDRLKHAKATAQRQKLYLKQYTLKRNRKKLKPGEYQKQLSEITSEMSRLATVGALWRQPTASAEALIVAGDVVIAGGKGKVEAFAVKTGKPLWAHPVDGTAGGLAVADGVLFVSTDSGRVYGFANRDGVTEAKKRGVVASNRSPYPTDKLTPVYRAAAEQLLKSTGLIRTTGLKAGEYSGFCLVVDAGIGRLAYEISRRSKLRIYCVESDAKKIQRAQQALHSVGLYGTRITYVRAQSDNLPLARYFANLVTSDKAVITGKLPNDLEPMADRVKPCGGFLAIALPGNSPAAKLGVTVQQLAQRITKTELTSHGKLKQVGQVALIERGKLPGAGSWSHQYGNVGNTMMSKDFRLRRGLRVLWFGDPGPSEMINRHEAASAPLSTNGRMFIQGIDSIRAYDAYNGTFLWRFKNPGAIRTGVFNNEVAGNLAASDDYVFIAVGNQCTVLDAATGKVKTVHKTPPSKDKIARVWGFVAHSNRTLFGTSTVRQQLKRSLRRRGRTVSNATDAIFAFDLETNQRKWTYQGKKIEHVTIAIGDGRVFFIDSSVSREQRADFLKADKTALKKLGAAEAKAKEAELKKRDVRLAVCLNAQTGKKIWSQTVDVTDCSRVGIGGGNLTLMYHDQHVLICGANANGHYWRQFLSGQFNRRRLVVLNAKDGKKIWSKDANYRHRPIIVGEEIIAEPWSFNLKTGKQRTRENPVTGKQTPWQFSRPGHHCGAITAAPNMLFFRSGFTGYYDMYTDSGTSHFAGHRMGCWVNAIPGNGLLMIPEASAGCVCQFSIASTVVMEPYAKQPGWRIYSAAGAKTPVKRLSLNLGAPGDRKDELGKLWLSMPRPKTRGRLEYLFKMKSKFAKGGKFFARNADAFKVVNAPTPWIYASGARGLTECSIPLRGKKDAPGTYTVRLHFVEPDKVKPGQRTFQLHVQGTRIGPVDVAKSEGIGRAMRITLTGIRVKDNLDIRLVRQGKLPPLLSAIEVTEE